LEKVENLIPQESETIAAKRAIRLSEKLRRAGEGLKGRNAWWSDGPLELLGLAFIFSLNFYLVVTFFGTSAPDIPYSGPVIPLFAKMVEFAGVPFSYAVQIVNAVFYLFFPLTYYMFVKKVTGRKLISLLVVLFASLPLYPFALVRAAGAFIGGDGPHMASLTLVPLAIYGLLGFIREGGMRNLIIASVSSGIIALISPFGFLTFALFAGITAFSEMLLGTGRLKVIRLLLVLIFAGALNSFWYNPAFFYWMITGPMGEDIRVTVSRLIPTSFFIIPILAAFGFLLFDRRPSLQPVFLASFFTIAFFLIVIAGGGLFPSHPSRYSAEFGIALSFLLGVGIVKFAEFLKFSDHKIFGKINATIFANALIVFVFVILVLGVILGRESVVLAEEKVLGIWTGFDKGELWTSRENFDGTPSFFGYSITGSAILTLAFLGIKSRQGVAH